MKEIELIEKRKPREKHFLQENGEIIAKIYGEDIHYLKNGKYEEIDNTLIQDENGFSNKSNSYKVHFNKEIKNSIMRMESNGHFIDIKLKKTQNSLLKKLKQFSKFTDEVKYENVQENIDLDYKVLSNKVKESIVLKNKNNVPQKLSFYIDTDLTLTLDNNSIYATDNNEIHFKIEEPFMIDSNNLENHNIYYELKKYIMGYELDLILDLDWLNSDEITYPVYIDPTITNSGVNNNVYDTYISSAEPNKNFNDKDFLKIGIEKSNGQNIINRALLKFDLPDLGTESQITNAYVRLIGYPSSVSNMYVRKVVGVYRLNADWDESTATWNNMHDKFNEKLETCFQGDRSATRYDGENDILVPHYTYVNITDLVQKWYVNTPNYGIMLKATPEEYDSDTIPEFFSKNNDINGDNPKPLLVIKYRNSNGLENYMSYQSQVFSNGSSHINDFNGNLTNIFNLYTSPDKSKVGIELVYNTNDVVLGRNYGYGLGYRLNYHQFINEVSLENTDYLEYNDADGTIHYFKKVNDIYKDEDGLNYVITKINSDYILNDTNGNVLKFEKNGNSYYLTEIKDPENNNITINYNNGIISKIIDCYNREVSFIKETSKLTINSPSETIELNYNNNQVLNIVKNVGTIQFTYNQEKLIEKITDIDGTSVKYEYYENKPYKVKKVTEYGLNNVLGKYFNIEYGFNYSTIIDHKNRISTTLFNSNGTVNTVSSLKNSDDIKNAYTIKEEKGTQDDKYKNKDIKTSIPIRYVNNLLTDTSFENNNIKFISDDNINISISNEVSHYGNNSLKLSSTETNKKAYYGVVVEKGKHYTFSAYVKNSNNIKLCLYYLNANNEVVEVKSNTIFSNDEFDRHDVTLNYEANASSNLFIKIEMLNAGIAYIDDIQLEEGDVVNNYNIIDNSDFSKGIGDWNPSADITYIDKDIPDQIPTLDINEYFEVIELSNNNKALKVKMAPDITTSYDKYMPFSGKKGDMFNVSFWYKSNGIEPSMDTTYNSVIFGFLASNGGGYCLSPSRNLAQNDENWQHFSRNYVADRDYDGIILRMIQSVNDGNMIMTNVSVYKDIREEYYDYDENGNVILKKELDDSETSYDYDNKNQLIKMTDSKGNSYKVEYDNNITKRPISSITPNGISSIAKYDTFGNLINVKTKYVGNLADNEVYFIRLKGTSKYVRYHNNEIVINEDKHDRWLLKKEETYYKICHSITNEYINVVNSNISLIKNSLNATLFELIEQKNGSYLIKIKDQNLYLKFETNALNISSEYVSDDYNYEFYFERENTCFIETSSKYTSDGKTLKSVTDELFNKTTYDIDSNTGLTKSVVQPNGKKTSYTYNSKKQVITTTDNEKVVNYSYNDKNLLEKISSGTKDYLFTYDEFLKNKEVKIGQNITLINNNYESNDGNLISSTYGNGDVISYTYDEFDRVEKVIKQDATYTYKYDNNGNLAKILSSKGNIKYKYDFYQKLHSFMNNDFSIGYKFDKNDNVINKKISLSNSTFNETREFNKENCLSKLYIGNNVFEYEYDELGRIQNKKINNNSLTKYGYVTLGKKTSKLINYVNNNGNITKYRYDKMKNITHIYTNNVLTNRYFYDLNNQLIREDNYRLATTTKYKYDLEGNVLSKKICHLNTDEVITVNNYTYGDSSWEDRLTKFNDKNITYDEIGNPTTIGQNITLNWINGRELNSCTIDNKIINYDYNIDGIRTSKKINGVETKYYLENSKIIVEKTNNNMIYYIYDDLGSIIGFKYNNEMYYYMKNLQNDIIEILDSNLNSICKYTYDSFGNILSIVNNNGLDISNDESHIANINPFRYRSYYYDKETKLYYLNSRYYNPEWGRFINADGIIGVEDNITKYNLFVYCENNFVNKVDYDGNLAITVSAVSAIGTVLFLTAVYAGSKFVSKSLVQAAASLPDVKFPTKKETTKKEDKKKQEKKYVVYVLCTDKKCQDVVYVGRTNDFERRSDEHKRNPERKKLYAKIEKENLTYEQSRIYEQKLIEMYMTLNSGREGCNKRNGINWDAPKNKGLKDYYDLYFNEDSLTYVGGCR